MDKTESVNEQSCETVKLLAAAEGGYLVDISNSYTEVCTKLHLYLVIIQCIGWLLRHFGYYRKSSFHYFFHSPLRTHFFSLQSSTTRKLINRLQQNTEARYTQVNFEEAVLAYDSVWAMIQGD